MTIQNDLWRVLIVLVLAITVFGLGACVSNAKPPAEEMTTEEAMFDGEAALQDSCTRCHDLERTISKQKTREQWEQTVDNMIQKGSQVVDKQALLDYLAETYGP